MKIAFINDSHFGARNDSPEFLESFISFYEDVFFPYLLANDIDTVVHLGDFFDRRKYVNFHTLYEVRNRVIVPLEKMGIKLHVVLGNHDTYFRNTNEVNSLVELFSKNENFNIIDRPTTINFGDMCIGFVPWITNENNEESMAFIEDANCPIICGHFEINGFEIMRGVRFEGGPTSDKFKKYEMVLSGHFHHKSTKDNIYYLGTQYQITFSDMNEKKGFHIFDTTTRELEFIENPREMFHSIIFNDKNSKLISELDTDLYKKSFIKVMVVRKKSQMFFDSFIEKLNKAGVYGITIIDDIFTDDKEDEIIDISKDTMALINEEIDAMEITVDKNEIKKLLHEIYLETISS